MDFYKIIKKEDKFILTVNYFGQIWEKCCEFDTMNEAEDYINNKRELLKTESE